MNAYFLVPFVQVRVLDYKRVKDAERKEAKEMFEGRKGEQLLRELSKRQTAVQATATSGGAKQPTAGSSMLMPEQVSQIREAIVRARTLEEVDRLNQILRSGQLPAEFSLGAQRPGSNTAASRQLQAQNEQDMETDDD